MRQEKISRTLIVSIFNFLLITALLSGCGGGGGGEGNVTEYTLQVTVNGQGTVKSNDSNLDCPGDCIENYARGTQITLTATPNTGWQFDGWSGDADCSDNQITMDADRSCTALFSSTETAYESSSFGVHGAYASSPFFQQKMGFSDDEYLSWVSGHMRAINAHFTRRNTLLIWDVVDPDINNPDDYDWDTLRTDKTLINIYKSGNNIHALVGFDTGQNEGNRDPLDYPDKFKSFIQDVVERYDGDGIDDVETDLPVRVKYWQAGNEWPNWTEGGRTRAEYVEYYELIEEGAHAADPDAKIVLISHMPASSLDEWWKPTVLALKGKLDAVDLHEWGDASDWKMTHLIEARAFLDSNGMSDVEIWTGEDATHTGQPGTPALRPYQTLEEQARFLVKRISWSRANGLSKFFWSLIMDRYAFMGDPESFFNSIGLIGDGEHNNEPVPGGATDGFNARRNIYWAYKLLAEKTDSTVAIQLGEMSLTDENAKRWGYEYQLKTDNRHVFVLWTEESNQALTFSVNASSVYVTDLIDVNESGTFANEYDVNTVNGTVTLTVGENPLMVIEN